MRKKKPGVGRSAGKGVRVSAEAKRALSPGKKVSGTGQGAPKDVDKYIARLPEPVRSRLMEMRAVIRSAGISYQIPEFKTKKVLGMVRALFETLQLVPYRVGDRGI
jgi:hypothetical protein